jgi:hypothetical protein
MIYSISYIQKSLLSFIRIDLFYNASSPYLLVGIACESILVGDILFCHWCPFLEIILYK